MNRPQTCVPPGRLIRSATVSSQAPLETQAVYQTRRRPDTSKLHRAGAGWKRMLVLTLVWSALASPWGDRTAGAMDEDRDAAQLLQQARKADAEQKPQQAERLLTELIERAGDQHPEAYYWRGRARFQLHRVAASVEDFDKYVALRPELASRQWERGIACYYAKQYQKGADQFKLYQTYHDNDVENSVWRFLCMAPVDGVVEARAALLPIRNDRRVPMMQIYELFGGKLKPADVLQAVQRDEPAPEVLSGRLFYARLYLGLYYEVHGEPKLARQYILLAADKHRDDQRINRYMWAVADVHAARYRKPSEADRAP